MVRATFCLLSFAGALLACARPLAAADAPLAPPPLAQAPPLALALDATPPPPPPATPAPATPPEVAAQAAPAADAPKPPESNPLQRAQPGGPPPKTSGAAPTAGAGATNEDRGPELSKFWLYRNNYFAWQPSSPGRTLVKFQISVRYDLVTTQSPRNALAFSFAYTQKSFWDLFAFHRSSPFVENDYKPEAFVSYRPRRADRTTELSAGIQHESNGLGNDVLSAVDQTMFSRGWNSLYAGGRYGFDGLSPTPKVDIYVTLGLRVWYSFVILPANLMDYIGHGMASLDLDIHLLNYPRAGHLALELLAHERSVEGSLFFPLAALSYGYVRASLYAQVFYGYAERLITFDQRTANAYVGLGFL